MGEIGDICNNVNNLKKGVNSSNRVKAVNIDRYFEKLLYTAYKVKNKSI